MECMADILCHLFELKDVFLSNIFNLLLIGYFRFLGFVVQLNKA